MTPFFLAQPVPEKGSRQQTNLVLAVLRFSVLKER